MPSKRPKQRLLDIVENADAIAGYIAGLNQEAFIKDRKTCDAVERCLQRISEAAVKLGEDAERLIPSQPWKQIRSLGNALRHDYDKIDSAQIWVMAFQQVPELARLCKRALEKPTL